MCAFLGLYCAQMVCSPREACSQTSGASYHPTGGAGHRTHFLKTKRLFFFPINTTLNINLAVLSAFPSPKACG